MTILPFFERINGTLYQPVIKKINGRDVRDLIPVACGNCKHYECEDLLKTTNINMAVSCEKWEVSE